MIWTLLGYPLLWAVVSCGLTRLVLVLLRRHAVVDTPNDRSNHVTPTPRGGGIAVILTVLLGWWLAPLLVSDRMIPFHWQLYLATALLAMFSFADDLKPVPAWQRLCAQVLAVCLVMPLLDTPLFPEFLPPWLSYTLMALGWLWFINLFNFMDGIDGITGMQTLYLAAGLAALALATPIHDSYVVYASVVGAAAVGFLVWNWHPAKLFLGDVGSVPLGFLLGFLLLHAATHGYPVFALILPLYYVADATLTLLRRAKRGAKLWEAHSEHAYQQAVRSGKSHAKVVITIAACNAMLGVLAFAMVFDVMPWWVVLPLACGVVGGTLQLFSRKQAV
jgi:UDP-N-acetylmuramyl pentapeptide phosphotransferase/UDP-N-acetylglucosamine-1-phosphate transferase